MLTPRRQRRQNAILLLTMKFALSTRAGMLRYNLEKAPTVADQYWPQSALLPTISNTIRYNRKLKIAYFDDFLKKKPYGTVLEDYIDNKGCNYVQVYIYF
jgi:hypothetical protein